MKRMLLKSLLCSLVVVFQVLSFSVSAFALENSQEDESAGRIAISIRNIGTAEKVLD